MVNSPVTVRAARTSDVPAILALVEPLVSRRILLGKERVDLYGAIQEFRVAELSETGEVIGAGALHAMWEDLGEVRTLVVADAWLGHGVGHAIVDRLVDDARELGLSRLFCLTFEVDFFARHGFVDMGAETVAPEVYAELVRSHDDGVAEFLDLARVKQNTLGNTRMLKSL
ncbi:amino-acid N-acetyltransferase [Agromyces aureus]|uniref:N-acetylglutamate synthase n=1 Tax=Agromyces aureus TaxID=453304 RepID=A0A191WI15_9MICO|nr:amino-acid N-acetyltransferase [Agromyces aureus]ANJ27950.1 N-acetylglutamate synthase [Agromyces aureus]